MGDSRGDGVEDATHRVDVMRQYWDVLVTNARAGNIKYARDVLEDFAEAVEHIASFREPEKAWSGPIPWQIAEYLAQAFRQILTGSNPTKALNLVGRRRGRRKGRSVTHNPKALAAAFWFLRCNGLTAEEANEALKEKLGADRATIHRARQECQAYEWIGDEDLKVALQPYWAQVAAVLEDHVAQKPSNPAADSKN